MPPNAIWWICTKCNKRIHPAGQGAGLQEAKATHRGLCQGASYQIEQRR